MGLKEIFKKHYTSQEAELRQCSDEELVQQMTKRNRETGKIMAVVGVCLGGMLVAGEVFMGRGQQNVEAFMAVYATGLVLTTAVIARGTTVSGERDIIREIAEERGFITVKEGFAFNKIEK